MFVHTISALYFSCHLVFKTITYTIYFNCVLLPHLFIFEHAQIEMFHVIFLLYPFQIDLNRSNYTRLSSEQKVESSNTNLPTHMITV